MPPTKLTTAKVRRDVFCFTWPGHSWYSFCVYKSYVGIISRHGLESFFPENDHIVRFLVRRAYRRQPPEALCYWAVMPDSTADDIQWQLSCGDRERALATLHASAVGLGTMLPYDRDDTDALSPRGNHSLI